MTTNTATTSFEHDYDDFQENYSWKFRSTYCCGLLEVHGLQSMETEGGEYAEPVEDEWEEHLLAHLAYRLRHKEMYGQVYFTYVTQSDDCQETCGECYGDGGWHDDDDDWRECDYCGGSGLYGDAECHPVWDDLMYGFKRHGIPLEAWTKCPEFKNPNTSNMCQVLILNVDLDVRAAMRKFYESVNYTGEFSHR